MMAASREDVLYPATQPAQTLIVFEDSLSSTVSIMLDCLIVLRNQGQEASTHVKSLLLRAA